MTTPVPPKLEHRHEHGYSAASLRLHQQLPAPSQDGAALTALLAEQYQAAAPTPDPSNRAFRTNPPASTRMFANQVPNLLRGTSHDMRYERIPVSDNHFGRAALESGRPWNVAGVVRRHVPRMHTGG